MVWAGRRPDEQDDPEIVRLGPDHAARAMELASLTRPGPFGPRTIELGDYFGLFAGDLLIAMAGERMRAGPYRELSGVCTHPDYQGRGLAGRLMRTLIRRELDRGETPFLHVMEGNSRARLFYERMGFRTYRPAVVRVIFRIH
jgi:GNAT superfamily N-acetyltransferase